MSGGESLTVGLIFIPSPSNSHTLPPYSPPLFHSHTLLPYSPLPCPQKCHQNFHEKFLKILLPMQKSETKGKEVVPEQTQQPEATGDDQVFIAEVVNVYGRSGAGGSITQCKVLLRHNNRSIIRSIEGPIRVGDLLSLRECVRESRRSR